MAATKLLSNPFTLSFCVCMLPLSENETASYRGWDSDETIALDWYWTGLVGIWAFQQRNGFTIDFKGSFLMLVIWEWDMAQLFWALILCTISNRCCYWLRPLLQHYLLFVGYHRWLCSHLFIDLSLSECRCFQTLVLYSHFERNFDCSKCSCEL